MFATVATKETVALIGELRHTREVIRLGNKSTERNNKGEKRSQFCLLNRRSNEKKWAIKGKL